METELRPGAPHRIPLPKRVKLPALPNEPLVPPTGQWVWTCRAGFEAQLFEELAWAKAQPEALGQALFTSRAVAQPPVFARMGFPVSAVVRTAADAARALPQRPALVQVWVPDTDAGNARAGEAKTWQDALGALRSAAQIKDPETPWAAHESNALLGQVCLLGPSVAAVGVIGAREALSLSAGGRARMKRTADAPSRAAMKLDEALDWLGLAPARGDVCVDLGSAPGGWTRRLVERGARVWSVDPGRLAPDLEKHGKVRHFFESAFQFEPPERADWLFCDMAWRPLEVAQMLGKWSRRKWASQLVSNFKLPMKDKWPTILRVKSTLEEAGWKNVKIRQLYHDRDEVTLTATRGA